MFHVKSIFKSRNFSNISSIPQVLKHLKERSLLKVIGNDVSGFLQGLITNDVPHLNNGFSCMYTLFLNTKGRVLYDTIVYRTTEKDALLIECDSAVTELLAKHLQLYKVKRKIAIEIMEDYTVYALYNTDINMNLIKCCNPELVVPCTSVENINACRTYRDLSIYRDPRLEYLGLRVLAPIKADVKHQINEIFNIQEDDRESYRMLRYKLGIGEGVNDLPPNNCFPLECNCDYLHGISFHKGCYIGQEFTARTHHTGVVRKRLMPLYFKTVPTTLPPDNIIMHENNNLGRLRGIEGNVGLALLRVAKVLEFSAITVGNGIATTLKPSWWPVEAPKDRMSIIKG